MKNRNCLSEKELTLHYYGELPAKGKQEHLSGCPQCALRFSSLEKDLAQLPDLGHVPDALAGARMVARVGEQLNGRRKRWLPALGASAVTVLALCFCSFCGAHKGVPLIFKFAVSAAVWVSSDLKAIESVFSVSGASQSSSIAFGAVLLHLLLVCLVAAPKPDQHSILLRCCCSRAREE